MKGTGSFWIIEHLFVMVYLEYLHFLMTSNSCLSSYFENDPAIFSIHVFWHFTFVFIAVSTI